MVRVVSLHPERRASRVHARVPATHKRHPTCIYALYLLPIVWSHTSDRRQWVAHVALFAITVATFASTFRAEFVWDDRAAVVGNMNLRPESSWWTLLEHDFWGQNITLECVLAWNARPLDRPCFRRTQCASTSL
jgi:hypothetical protein